MHDRWNAIVTRQEKGACASLARAGLALGSALYAAGLKANLWVYTSGLKRRTRPQLPVISVGNLSLGGTGKTTAAAFIAKQLQHNIKPGIVLRGYRRAARGGPLIVSDGDTIRATLAEAGDEALMLARQLPGCAIAVGKRREQVIEALRQQATVQAVVLDDGFQYFRMERELDIVLLDALAEDSAWRLFPAGRLREPVAHLARADHVWITHADLAPPESVEALRELARRHCPGRPVATTRHRLGPLRPLDGRQEVPAALAGKTIIALSALGNPEAFELGLEQLGAEVRPLRFPDHHAYVSADYDRVISRARESSAELVVTTEKDAVKLSPPPDDCPPVAVLGCELEIIEGAAQFDASLHAMHSGSATAAS